MILKMNKEIQLNFKHNEAVFSSLSEIGIPSYDTYL